jgi:hypothetical protein
MQLFKIFILCFVVTACFSCNSNGNKKSLNNINGYDFAEIELLLLGKTLYSENKNLHNLKKQSNYSYNCNYVGDKNNPNEINLTINSNKNNNCYQALLLLYNNNFSTNKLNDTFNSWSTDSLEILLYKQTDSTILVNIFSKTYK